MAYKKQCYTYDSKAVLKFKKRTPKKRYIQFCDTYFVLMEKCDLEPWRKQTSNFDDLADYVFLCDNNFYWLRLSKRTIMIENRFEF